MKNFFPSTSHIAFRRRLLEILTLLRQAMVGSFHSSNLQQKRMYPCRSVDFQNGRRKRSKIPPRTVFTCLAVLMTHCTTCRRTDTVAARRSAQSGKMLFNWHPMLRKLTASIPTNPKTATSIAPWNCGCKGNIGKYFNEGVDAESIRMEHGFSGSIPKSLRQDFLELAV